jgi:hypothetical protein
MGWRTGGVKGAQRSKAPDFHEITLIFHLASRLGVRASLRTPGMGRCCRQDAGESLARAG